MRTVAFQQQATADAVDDGVAQMGEAIIESLRAVLKGNGLDETAPLLPADAFFAYRLLLRRNPDLMVELTPLLRGTVPFRSFLDLLLGSTEFDQTAGLLPSNHLLMSEVEGFRFWFNSSDREMGVRMGLGLYEPATVDLLKRILRPGMRCLDVGAQTGFFTCLMASSVTRRGYVYAFEPMPPSFQLLTRNLRENRLSNRVRALPCACSDRAASLQVSLVSNMYVVGATVDGRSSVSVDAVRVDDVVDNGIDVVKIDIEGHEPSAIAGMRNLIAESRPIIISEANDYWLRTCSASSAGQYVELLNSLGYAVYRVEDLDTPVDHRRLWPDPLEAVNILAVPSEVKPNSLMSRGARNPRANKRRASTAGSR